MNRLSRLNKAEKVAGEVVTRELRKVKTVMLTGADGDAIIDAIEAAIAPDDFPIWEDIDRQVQFYHEHRDQRRDDTECPDDHGLLAWIDLIAWGRSALPVRITRQLLLRWRDGFEEYMNGHPNSGPWSPRPYQLCVSCRVSLPNGRASAESPACPLCGGDNILPASHARPMGAAWIKPIGPSRSVLVDIDGKEVP